MRPKLILHRYVPLSISHFNMKLHLYLTYSSALINVTHRFAVHHTAFSCGQDEAENQAFHLNTFKLCCLMVTDLLLGLATVGHWPKERAIQCNSGILYAVFRCIEFFILYAYSNVYIQMDESVFFSKWDHHNED